MFSPVPFVHQEGAWFELAQRRDSGNPPPSNLLNGEITDRTASPIILPCTPFHPNRRLNTQPPIESVSTAVTANGHKSDVSRSRPMPSRYTRRDISIM